MYGASFADMGLDGGSARWTPGHRAPWAVAINQHAATADVEISLVACTVLADILRVSGIVVVHRPSMQLAHVPTLFLSRTDRELLPSVNSLLLPYRDVSWTSWFFTFRDRVAGRYGATIRTLEVSPQFGRDRTVIDGPWRFAFDLPDPA